MVRKIPYEADSCRHEWPVKYFRPIQGYEGNKREDFALSNELNLDRAPGPTR